MSIRRHLSSLLVALLPGRSVLAIGEFLRDELKTSMAHADALERLCEKLISEVKDWRYHAEELGELVEIERVRIGTLTGQRNTATARAEKAEAELAIARPKAFQWDSERAWERELDEMERRGHRGEEPGPRPLKPIKRLTRTVRPEVEIVDDAALKWLGLDEASAEATWAGALEFLAAKGLNPEKVLEKATETVARMGATRRARDGAALVDDLLAAAETKPTDPPVLSPGILDATPAEPEQDRLDHFASRN